MSPGEIVYQGKTKDGRDLILRYPKREDLEKLLEYINALSNERTFIRKQGKQFTLEEEKNVLEGWLKTLENQTAVHLLAFEGETLIGITGVTLNADGADNHIGTFGISVTKEYRGQGVGKALMEKVLETADRDLPKLKIITLTCFAGNLAGINLYKEMGFVEFGILPEGLQRNGEFDSQIYMYKKIR